MPSSQRRVEPIEYRKGGIFHHRTNRFIFIENRLSLAERAEWVKRRLYEWNQEHRSDVALLR